MSKICSKCLFSVLLLAAASAWSAKDTTKPGPVTGLSVQPTIRALTLRFTATGDDGTSGTVAGYDVRVKPMTGDCSGNPSTWPVAPNTATPRNHGLMAAPGSPDNENVRPLAPGTAYCVAIRAFDEVPNYSATWAVGSGTTLDGDWPLASIPVPTAGSLPTAHLPQIALDEASSGPGPRVLVTWRIDSLYASKWVSSGIGFATLAVPETDSTLPPCGAGDCYEQIMLTNPLLSTYIDAFAVSGGTEVAPIPGRSGIAGLLVRGTKTVGGVAQARTLLLERDASGVWTSQLVPGVEVFIETGAAQTNLVYLPDAHLNPTADPNGAWNPAFTWERVDSVSSTQRTATLMLAERVGGTWTNTPLFARKTTSSSPMNPVNWPHAFTQRELFARPDGSLALFVTPRYGLNAVYAIRQLDGSWSYYDAAPDYDSPYGVAPTYTIGLDENGQVLVTAAVYLSTRLGLLRQAAFAGPFAGLPPMNVAPIVGASAWSLAYSQSPGAASGVFGNTCTNGTIQIPATTVVMSLRPDNSVDVLNGDSVDGSSSLNGAVGLPNGDTAMVYVWGRAPDFVHVARARTGNCP